MRANQPNHENPPIIADAVIEVIPPVNSADDASGFRTRARASGRARSDPTARCPSRSLYSDGLGSPAAEDQGKNTRSTMTSVWNSTIPMIESRIMAPKATGVLKNAVDDVIR